MYFKAICFQCLTFNAHHQRQRDGKTQKQTSSQRSDSLGFKTESELVWDDWNLEGEFTKTLVLKNVHSKQRLIRVR